MIMGVGVDLLKISRLENGIASNDPFIMKVFTKREILEAEQSKNKLLYFASRYACKEAVFKCLKVDGNLIRLNEIEILNSEIGAPEVHLLEDLKRMSLDKGISGIEVSLSFEEEYVMAYAVAQN